MFGNQEKEAILEIKIANQDAIPRGPNPPPDLPPKFQDAIEAMGGPIIGLLVIQKKLFKTDITKGNNRFSIPLRQMVRTDFSPEEEA